MDVKNMMTRACSGIIYVAVIVVAIVMQQPWFMLLTGVLAVWASIEFFKLNNDIGKQTVVVLCLNALTTLCIAMSSSVSSLLPLVAVLVLARFIYTLYDHSENPVASLAYSVFSYIYIGVSLALLNMLEEANWRVVMMLFCALWINDTGAYLVGSLCGRHKLFERISPKKTWEGFFGGLALNIIMAFAVAHWIFSDGQPIVSYISNTSFLCTLALVASVIGTLGDLLESLLKRTCHVKDSGHLIPGHGGILDRIDSLLLAAPAMLCIYLCLI